MRFFRKKPVIGCLAFSIVAAVLLSVSTIFSNRSEPYHDLAIEVVGSDFVFHFRYPGIDRKLFSADDRHGSGTLFVPAGAKIHLKLTSLDYIYTFEVPARGVYEMAAPDLVFDTELAASLPRDDELLGSQMCGYDHAGLLGRMVVQTTEDFDRTMASLSPQSLVVKQP